jgi:uncharacterized protein YgbK (DUF1537 family)
MDIDGLLNGRESEQPVAKATEDALSHLAVGRSVIVHSFRKQGSLGASDMPCRIAEILGNALGRVLAACAPEGKLRRVCIAGGDTASYVARAIGIDCLEMIAPFTRGAPLCRLHSQRPEIDGLEAVFKAGQVGRPDLFVKLAQGAG